MIQKMVEKLERSHQTVDELVKVFSAYGVGYNQDQGYADELEYKKEDEAKF